MFIIYKTYEWNEWQVPGTGATTLPAISRAMRHLQKQHQQQGKSNNPESILGTDSGGLPPVLLLYDIDALVASYEHVKKSFDTVAMKYAQIQGVNTASGSKFEAVHCFAVKSSPLSYILYTAVQRGLGLECASLMEVKQALRCGCEPSKVIFDSPCKTAEELVFGLNQGVHINVNSVGELEKIKEILAFFEKKGVSTKSTIGLRINPLVGGGKIAALSTATTTSKFGIPLLPLVQESSAGHAGGEASEETLAAIKAQRAKILKLFVDHPFVTGIMCHVGSQGIPMGIMVEGAKRIVDFADEVDAACGSHRITSVDIGGGISVNYNSDEVSPTFHEYAEALLVACPTIFNGQRKVITGECCEICCFS